MIKEVESLDSCETEDVIYIAHFSNPKNLRSVKVSTLESLSNEKDIKSRTYISDTLRLIYDVDKNVINNSDAPYLINEKSHEVYDFIMRYIEYCDYRGYELPEYKAPLPRRITYVELLGEEYKFFEELIKVDKCEMANLLNQIMELANHLMMHKLLYKVASMFALMFKLSTPDEHIKIAESMKNQ